MALDPNRTDAMPFLNLSATPPVYLVPTISTISTSNFALLRTNEVDRKLPLARGETLIMLEDRRTRTSWRAGEELRTRQVLNLPHHRHDTAAAEDGCQPCQSLRIDEGHDLLVPADAKLAIRVCSREGHHAAGKRFPQDRPEHMVKGQGSDPRIGVTLLGKRSGPAEDRQRVPLRSMSEAALFQAGLLPAGCLHLDVRFSGPRRQPSPIPRPLLRTW